MEGKNLNYREVTILLSRLRWTPTCRRTELADRVFCIYILMGEEWHEHGSARAICLSSRPLCLPEVPNMRRHSFAIVPIGARNSIE